MENRQRNKDTSPKVNNDLSEQLLPKENFPEVASNCNSKDGIATYSKHELSPGICFVVADGSGFSDLNECPGKPNGSSKHSRKSTDSEGCNLHADPGKKSYDKSFNQNIDKCSEVNFSDSKLDEVKKKDSYKKKKSVPWYMMLSPPTYKSRSEDFKKQFKCIPKEERLIVDYSCALQKDILVQGRMFITQNYICFYANIFRWETIATIPMKEIHVITKEKTARVIPNAIQITTEKEKYFFTSFATRDKTFIMIFKLWQNALMDQSVSSQEIWQWIHSSYGEELGLQSSDDDYVPPADLIDCKDVGSKDNSPIKKVDSFGLLQTCDLQYLGENGTSEANGLCPDESLVPILTVHKEDIDMTDCSDNTEEDCISEGEIICSEHDHFARLAHNEVYQMSVDKLFDLLFTDSDFFRNFMDARKITDVSITDWKDDPEGNIGHYRELAYTVPLNAPFGPKCSRTIEKNIYCTQNKPGLLYVIDAECSPTGIPYADSFYVANRYCLTRVGKQKCKLQVTSEVKYRKSVWGMVKNMIEHNSVQGVLDYFQCLGIHLHKLSEKNEHLLGQPKASKRKLRKRRSYTMRNASISSEMQSVCLSQQLNRSQRSQTHVSEKLVVPPALARNAQATQKEEKLISLNTPTLVKIVCFILMLLVLFNALLFCKLWSLETMANVLSFPNSQDALDSFVKHSLKSHGEWIRLLNQQQLLHNAEMRKWQDLLGVSITVVDQMQQTLVNLKKQVDRTDLKLDTDEFCVGHDMGINCHKSDTNSQKTNTNCPHMSIVSQETDKNSKETDKNRPKSDKDSQETHKNSISIDAIGSETEAQSPDMDTNNPDTDKHSETS